MVMSMTILNAQNSDTKKDTYIFIDISGSNYSFFKEMQNYAIDSILPSVKTGSKLSIYKFYGNCVNIYNQTVKTDNDLKFAKDRISKLLPNGPWTNLDLIKSVIKENNIDLKTSNVYILTDGHQELKNGENEYYLSEENISDFFENCDLIKKGSFFILIPKNDKNIPKISTIASPSKENNPYETLKKTEPQGIKITNRYYKKIILFFVLVSLLLISIDTITLLIWKKEKDKSMELKQYENHINCWRRNFLIALICLFANTSIAFTATSFLNMLPVIIVFSTVFIITSVFTIKNIIANVKYSKQIKNLYNQLIRELYIDLVEHFDIKASDCNEVLYLKRKKIEDLEFDKKFQEKQLLLGLALKKINNTNAIGIQRFSNFYFINLEAIFKELNLRFTIEERKQIANFIAKSYGNNKLDKFDWTIGASIGLITGLMDVFFVGKPGDSKLQKTVDNFEEKIVKLASKICGYTGNSNAGAVKKLEDKFWVPYDKTIINEINMTKNNHHFISLAHSNDIIGLLFAILDTKLSIDKTKENNGVLYTVVTCNYSKDPITIEKIKQNPKLEFVWGGAFVRLVEPLTFQKGNKRGEEKKIDDLGKKVKNEKNEKNVEKVVYKFIYEKCKDSDETMTIVWCTILGFVLWLGHLYSDRIGAGSTVKKGNRGSGITAPFQELFANVNINIGNKILEGGKEKIKKELDNIGKKMFEKGFDNRFYNVQKIPVLINEYLTKITYICKEIFYYEKEIDAKDIIKILFAEGMIKTTSRTITGTSNFELEKALLISFSTFSLVDVTDAVLSSKAITQKGGIPKFVPNIDTFLYINYAGLVKLGKESVSVLLSYIRRWSTNPQKIVKEIEDLAKEIDSKNSEEANTL